MSSARQLPPGYNLAVQGLRGFSAVSVLIVHLFLMSDHAGFQPTRLPWLLTASVATLGNGVSLFFMISGFVIPASLERHGDLKRFFKDRLLRVMPLFLTLHILVFGVGPFLGYKWLLGISPGTYLVYFFTNLLFIAPFFNFPLAQQNAWTLTYEWIFYGMSAAGWRTRNSRLLFPCVLLVSGALIAFRPISLFFVIGMIFARVRSVPGLPRCAEIIVLPLSLVSFYGLLQYVGAIAALLPGAVLFALVIMPGSLTSRMLECPPLQFLGKISYSLYLLHPVALFPLQMIFGHLAAAGANHAILFLIFVTAGTPMVVGLSALSYMVIEDKGRRWLAGWLTSHQQTAATLDRVGSVG